MCDERKPTEVKAEAYGIHRNQGRRSHHKTHIRWFRVFGVFRGDQNQKIWASWPSCLRGKFLCSLNYYL